MATVDVFDSVARLGLPEAAARLAAAHLPVFPCVPGDKRPLIGHGFHAASTDQTVVARWWSRWPAANIGLPTGSASGWDVVDVDRKENGAGFEAFEDARRADFITGWAMLIRTPSGGVHAYFPADPSRPQPSWQAARARIDFRGTGGYVLAPPSAVVRLDGTRYPYMLIARGHGATARVDALALREFLDPRAAALHRPTASVDHRADQTGLATWVAALGEGERNRGLFWAACRMAESGADHTATVNALAPAAEQTGLSRREIHITIRSAYRTTTHPSPTASTSGTRPVGSLQREAASRASSLS